ncbi:MAG TPA: vWA domain-containing protein, partial [Polyangia bacterium]
IDVIDEQAPEQNFGTPLGPALEGTLAHLRMHRQAHPERRTVLAVISDGEVTACGPTAPSEVSAPVRRARLNDGITTHVLSVTDGSPLANEDVFMLDALAAAGGTGAPQFFDAADDLTFNLGRALDAIHAAERPCAFDVPEAALRGDGRSTEVSFAVGGATLKLPSLAGVNACAAARDGWFVATLANGPARIGLCEGTCRRLRADPAATLEVRRTCAER